MRIDIGLRVKSMGVKMDQNNKILLESGTNELTTPSTVRRPDDCFFSMTASPAMRHWQA